MFRLQPGRRGHQAELEIAAIGGALNFDGYADNPRDYLRMDWIPPRWMWIDPLKDRQAEILAVDAGFKARSQVIEDEGTRKMDGWRHGALSTEARVAFQGHVDHCRDALCDLVGRQGRMSARDALATEAATYPDTDAVEARLADGIRTFDEVLASLTAQVSQNSQSRMAALAANRGASAMTTQKDQMLSGASPTAVAAAQNSAAVPAQSPPPTAEAPGAPEATAAAKPKPGETCATCGQVMPDDDNDDGMPVDPNATAPGYTVETAMETMDLCAIAKLPLSDAKAFVNAKTPLATVRSELARRAADATDALAVDGTAKPVGAAEAAVAAAWDSVVEDLNSKLPANTRR